MFHLRLTVFLTFTVTRRGSVSQASGRGFLRHLCTDSVCGDGLLVFTSHSCGFVGVVSNFL